MTDAAPDRIVGSRPRPTKRQSVVLALVGAAVTAGGVYGHDRFLMIEGPLFILALTSASWRPRTVVGGESITRPWCRHRFVNWSDVAGVLPPDPGFRGVRIRLRSGKTLSLRDIPEDAAADVAHLGGKEVLRPEPPRPTPRSVVRTDMEVEADVTRKAQALAEHRKQMAAESARLHWKP